MKANPNDAREFILLDFMGNELKVGDACIVSAGSTYSSFLILAMIKEIKKCPKSVRIYYQQYGTHYDWSTYTGCDYGESNTRHNMFYKIENIAYEIDKKDAARLFVAKNDLEAKLQEKQNEK